MFKILCICNQGENRSRTTAEILASTGKYEARYDGFYKNRDEEASTKREVFNPRNLDWANKIIVFEDIHEDLLKKYGYSYWGKSYNFNIADLYYYNQSSLVKIIKTKLNLYEFL
jgi:predicted protein tyrosine phosphatase